MSEPRGSHAERRALLVALGVAWLLVVCRSLVFVLYEQSFFDSDQAIIGLMAKHLVEGRAFPLFYYGQGYLLGIDAIAAAAVFLVAGPTVASLHTGIVLLNLAAVTGMVLVLVRAGLRPGAAVIATSFFSFAPPLTSASLIEAGANIGPIVAVPLMWLVRERPVALGVVTAIGFVNREFTLYGVVALLALDAWQGRLLRFARWKQWLTVAASAAAVVTAVALLRPYADANGPGTRGERPPGFSGDAATNITSRMELSAGELPARLAAMVRDHLPELYGLRRVDASIARQGYDWLFWPVMIGLSAAFARGAWSARPAFGRPLAVEGAWYFVLVGTAAVAVYTISKPVGLLVPRYLLLSVFLPMGVTALCLARERRTVVAGGIVAIVLIWSAASATDHWRQVRRYAGGREPNEPRELARTLEARGIRVATAGYWIAYKVSFVSGERVRIASDDVVRVTEYQQLASDAGEHLTRIQVDPCPGGERVAAWYLCRAAGP